MCFGISELQLGSVEKQKDSFNVPVSYLVAVATPVLKLKPLVGRPLKA